MSCGSPTNTLYGTFTTTTTGDPQVVTSSSLSTSVILGTFPSSVCAETETATGTSQNGQCIRTTVRTLSFTYTTVATNQFVFTTRRILTSTEVVPTQTLFAGCSPTSQSPTSLLPGPSSGSPSAVGNSQTSASTSSNNSSSSRDGSSVVSDVTGASTSSSSNTGNTTDTGGEQSQRNAKSNIGAIVGGVVGGVVLFIMIFALLGVLWRRNRKMKKLLKAHEEEEKNNSNVNDAQLLPSPYNPYASFPGSPVYPTYPGYSGHPPATAETHEVTTTSPTSGAFRMSQDTGSHGYMPIIPGSSTRDDSPERGRNDARRAETIRYTPIHSREASRSTQARFSRLDDAIAPALEAILFGIEEQGNRPLSSSRPEASGTNIQHENNTNGMSAKAREALGYRQRNMLVAHNADEFDHNANANTNTDGSINTPSDDIIIPQNANVVRSSAPPRHG